MTTTDHRQELAEFLRGRREATRPDQVGLPAGRGRRTPGLRREEVAMLAGVSLTWYTWLEQGRRINASRDVLVAIGRALRLDDAGLEHLLSLAEPGTAGVVDVPATPPAALELLLEALMPSPAYVLGPRWEFLVENTASAPTLDGFESSECYCVALGTLAQDGGRWRSYARPMMGPSEPPDRCGIARAVVAFPDHAYRARLGDARRASRAVLGISIRPDPAHPGADEWLPPDHPCADRDFQLVDPAHAQLQIELGPNGSVTLRAGTRTARGARIYFKDGDRWSIYRVDD